MGTLLSEGILGKSISVGMDFESAMADVKKVTELSEGHSLKDFKQDILDLSKKLPMTAEEIAKIVSEGGKLGLASKEALEFGKTATAMGVAFEMGADEAGEAIGGLMANLQTDVKGIKDLGDSINYLADKGSSDAKNIVDIISRIGGMGNLVGLQRENMAALAATLDEVKIPAEVAGTTISSMLTKLSTADSLGEKAESAFRELGLSGDFMKKALNQNSQEAINLLLSRIKMLDKESQISVITNIFGNDSGMIGSMTTLVNGFDRYQELLKMANSEEKKGSMDKELINKCDTTSAALKILGNNISAIAIKFSDALLPAIKFIANALSSLISVMDYLFNNFPLLSSVLAIATTTFLLAKPAVLAYRLSLNYVSISALLFKDALIISRLKLLSFKNALSASNLALLKHNLSLKLTNLTMRAKTLTLGIYTSALKALGFVLGALNKAFKFVALGIRALSVAIMTNPIGLIIDGIAIAAGLIIMNWEKVKGWFMSFINWLKPLWQPIANYIKAVFMSWINVFKFFGNIFISVSSHIVSFFKAVFAPIKDFFVNVFYPIGEFLYNLFGGFFDYIAEKLTWVSKAIGGVKDAIGGALDFIGLGEDEEKEVKVAKEEAGVENKEGLKVSQSYVEDLKQRTSTKVPQTSQSSQAFSQPLPMQSTPYTPNQSVSVHVNGNFNISSKEGVFDLGDFAKEVQKVVLDALKKQSQIKANTTIYG